MTSPFAWTSLEWLSLEHCSCTFSHLRLSFSHGFVSSWWHKWSNGVILIYPYHDCTMTAPRDNDESRGFEDAIRIYDHQIFILTTHLHLLRNPAIRVFVCSLSTIVYYLREFESITCTDYVMVSSWAVHTYRKVFAVRKQPSTPKLQHDPKFAKVLFCKPAKDSAWPLRRGEIGRRA